MTDVEQPNEEPSATETAASVESASESEKLRLLARLHTRQTTWNRWLRVAWWIFALPVGFASWCSTFTLRALRVGGYAVAAFLFFIWSAMYVGIATPSQQNASHTTDVETINARHATTTMPASTTTISELSHETTTSSGIVTTTSTVQDSTTVAPITPATTAPAPASAVTPTMPKTTTTRAPITTTTTALAAPADCHPLSNSGKCYSAGQFCRNSDHGVRGVAGNGDAIVCRDNNGWRWEPA